MDLVGTALANTPPATAPGFSFLEPLMTNVVPFSGGKRCISCDEQIDPRRLRAQPDARKCITCASESETEVMRVLKNAPLRARSVIEITW